MSRRSRRAAPSRDVVLRDPVAARRAPYDLAEALLGCELYGLEQIEVRTPGPELVVLWLTLSPWRPMADAGFPKECVSLCIWPDGEVYAIPHAAANRRWLHRNSDDVRQRVWAPYGPRCHLGELCLWFPDDPRGLRWSWEDGFDQLVTLVHRHLQAEEFWRREERWPVEDAPHGHGLHPIRTSAMRDAAAQWRPAC